MKIQKIIWMSSPENLSYELRNVGVNDFSKVIRIEIIRDRTPGSNQSMLVVETEV
jgi:hypothetical protein